VKIVRLEVFVIGDGSGIDPDRGGVEPLACVRVHTDDGLSGLSEVFRVPPGVVRATVGGPDTHFGRLLLGQEVTHPDTPSWRPARRSRWRWASTASPAGSSST
jgi:hypothetical protein